MWALSDSGIATYSRIMFATGCLEPRSPHRAHGPRRARHGFACDPWNHPGNHVENHLEDPEDKVLS
ncbi:Hypothetical protein PFR_JS20-2_571 [Propionibacterium freudenreichii]|nr:Hypothetical protein PFR_JS20-1_567 [Propionibacterium freudenreichii]SCQ80170.1 Hypothetical protein PFR_JS20-2_571 [Propionibacterium freudenreichii]